MNGKIIEQSKNMAKAANAGRPTRREFPPPGERRAFGIWLLELFWDLVFGICSFLAGLTGRRRMQFGGAESNLQIGCLRGLHRLHGTYRISTQLQSSPATPPKP